MIPVQNNQNPNQADNDSNHGDDESDCRGLGLCERHNGCDPSRQRHKNSDKLHIVLLLPDVRTLLGPNLLNADEPGGRNNQQYPTDNRDNHAHAPAGHQPSG